MSFIYNLNESGGGNVLWGLVYILAFIAVILGIVALIKYV